MKGLLVLMVVWVGVVSVVHGGETSIRSMLENTLGALKKKRAANNPVCDEIYDMWWSNRNQEKVRAAFTTLDATCAQFTNNPEQCNNAAMRTGVMTAEAKQAPCTMVGAHSKRCLGNPCNHYNGGDCTLQNTAGQCIWWTKEDVKVLNKYYAENDIKDFDGVTVKKLTTHGCYRNPCNSPGEGNSPRDDCNAGNGDFEVPGLYKCTWCEGVGRLKGSGMGCQMISATSDSYCAPANTKADQNSVFIRVNDHSCQCDSRFPFCGQDIGQREEWVPKRG